MFHFYLWCSSYSKILYSGITCFFFPVFTIFGQNIFPIENIFEPNFFFTKNFFLTKIDNKNFNRFLHNQNQPSIPYITFLIEGLFRLKISRCFESLITSWHPSLISQLSNTEHQIGLGAPCRWWVRAPSITMVMKGRSMD